MSKEKSEVLISRAKLMMMINDATPDMRARLIGRACVVLFNLQTQSEQSSMDTNVDNMEGFTSADARSGSLTAKYFLKHGTLQDWQIERWTKCNVRGVMRIAKYHRQLNEAAVLKKEKQLRDDATTRGERRPNYARPDSGVKMVPAKADDKLVKEARSVFA